MKTRLDVLLEQIDPTRTIDEVAARVDSALNSFHVSQGRITKWDEFRDVLTSFFRHAENTILLIPNFKSSSSEIDWGRCCRLLMKEYGANGDKAAFEIVRTGTEGGFYGLQKRVARRMTTEYAGNEISARIHHFWNSLIMEEQFSVMDEYLIKFGHLLPSELTEPTADRIKVNFVKVLKEHPQLVKRMRNIGYEKI